LGQCVKGFDWRPEGDGYRCAGGTHSMTAEEAAGLQGDAGE